MAPRRYSSETRQAKAEETRRRIVEATLSLHAERGIMGTSWRDIAERADVSIGTVYNHFPSLDELVPACGALMYELTDPPSVESGKAALEGAASVEERLERLITLFYEFYERGEAYLEVDARERQLPMVQEWEEEMRSLRRALVGYVLRASDPDSDRVRQFSALLDFPIYSSFRREGVERREAQAVLLKVFETLARGGQDDE
jgi:AcrR family transcriptional regulator